MKDYSKTDLSIHKSVDDFTPQLGQEVTWSITVSNLGKSAAENVRVNDLLPEGMEFVSGRTSSGELDIAQGLWSIGSLGTGQEVTASITMVVTEVDDYINNTATVVTDSTDYNGYNDQNTIAVDPWEPTSADLSLVKTVNNPKPEVGEVVEWTVSVTNSGPDTAWNTQVKESLPDGLTLVGARASSGTFDFQSEVWNVGHLTSGEFAEIVISTSVDSEAGMRFVNTAVASSNTVDDDQSNNSAEASIMIVEPDVVKPPKPHPGDSGERDMMPHEPHSGYGVACYCASDKQEEVGADLQIVKLVDNPTPNLNSEVVWTILVTNNGPEDAENVIVNDNLPTGVEYVSDSTTAGSFDLAAGVWEIGDLANGESALLQITSIATDAAAVQTNIALVSSDTEDSNAENNVAQDSIDAVDADLAITKTIDDPAPNLGDEVVWTIEVVNNGPDTAENVVITDALPEGTTFVSSSNEDFNAETGEIALGDLAPDEVFSIDITVTVDDADGARTNVAVVSSDTFDSNLDNNDDNSIVDAVAADLMIEKSVDNPTPDLGSEVVWTIEVVNNGPDTAESVVVTDALPAGTTFVSSSDERFDADTGVIELGDLASGDSVMFDITVTVDEADTPQVNTATVSSPTFDNDPTNNEDDAVVDAVAADLELVKEVIPETAAPGDTVEYTITVTNQGPDAATGVEVEDILPEGVQFIQDTIVAATGSVFDEVEGIWFIGDIAVGEVATLTIEAEVVDTGELTNTAQVVASDQFDPDSSVDNDDGDQSEDDEDSAVLTVPDNPVPVAMDDRLEVTSIAEPVNAVIAIDHSGSTGTPAGEGGVDANGSTLAGFVNRVDDGTPTSRLQLIREAVIEFAGRDEINEIKLFGFDGSADVRSLDGVVHDNVSDWLDVSGSGPNIEVENFVNNLEADGFTNYIAALELSQSHFELDVDGNVDLAPDGPINYYFLTDGNPLDNNFSDEGATPNAEQTAEWEVFVDEVFNESYGIGFGPGVDRFDAIDLVSHPDDPGVDGGIPGVASTEENTIFAPTVQEIPSELFRTISESVTGNVFANDDSGADGSQIGGDAISSLTVDGTTYTFTGVNDGSGNADAFFDIVGDIPSTSFISGEIINTPLASGGRLEFNFADGSFEYFSPLATEDFTEEFVYTIADTTGDIDSASLFIDVRSGVDTVQDSVPLAELSLLSEDDDELFSAESMAAVRMPEQARDEWASDGTYNDFEMYDMFSVVV